MDNLNKLANFSAWIGKFFAFASFAAFLIIIFCKGLRQNCDQRTVSWKVNSAFILNRLVLSLISLSNSNVKTNKSFTRTGNTCYKANTFFSICFTLLYYIKNICYRCIRRNFVRLVSCNIFYRVAFIKRFCRFNNCRRRRIWTNNPIRVYLSLAWIFF